MFISKGWYGTLSEAHSFRQTQTAITVRYLLEGGKWFAYETPVLGPPWSIPVEFPLYQWIVALTAKTDLIDINPAGRLVGVLFFLSSLLPFFMILKTLGLSINQRLLILTLYCLSPVYIYWSRSFMIESTVLSLSLYYLWFASIYLSDGDQKKGGDIAFGIAVTGILAGMVKITTFFAFGATAFFWWLHHTHANKKILKLSSYSFILYAFILPLIATKSWAAYSDHIKELNPLAKGITSSGLNTWIFGTLDQKISLVTWIGFYQNRVSEVIGRSWLLPFSLIISILCSPKTRAIVWFSFFLFLLPLATFTNLHIVHNYYVYANGVFLIVSVGLICGDLFDSSVLLKRFVGLILFCAIVISSYSYYLDAYWPIQGNGRNLSKIANEFKKYTRPDDVIVIFGFSWSPEVPYSINRRAIVLDKDHQNDVELLRGIKRNLKNGGYQIGAIVLAHRKEDITVDQRVIDMLLKEFEHRDGYLYKEYSDYDPRWRMEIIYFGDAKL